jgi:DNA-binding transcriptional LysR family regulator
MVPRLGAATVLALIVVGQMLGSLACDHFGLLGLPHAATPRGARACRWAAHLWHGRVGAHGARAGFGLAYLTEQQCRSDIEAGRVLADSCPPFAGFHLYYPSRRHPTQAFSLLVDALRYREPAKTARKSSIVRTKAADIQGLRVSPSLT